MGFQKFKKYNDLINLFLGISSLLLMITIFLFGKQMFFRTFFSSTANGDERKFFSDLLYANSNGLSETINSGTSITFTTLSYYLNMWIDSPLMAVRLVSLFSGILIIILFYLVARKLLNNSLLVFQISLSLIYLLVIQLTLFIGYNDLLMHFFGILFFSLLLLPLKNKILQFVVLGFLFAAILATRKMAIIYLFTFICVYLVQLWYNSKINLRSLKPLAIIFTSFLIFFILFNASSLLSNSGFSFDDKILRGPISWAQWEYHNALLIDAGVQDRFHHVNISETQKYLEVNGPQSLPSSFFEMIIFNPLFTIKEFFIDLFTGIKYFVRQTAFWPFLFTFFFLKRLLKLRKLSAFTRTDFIYFFSLFYFLLICFIVITNLQMRWFTFFIPIMFILLGRDLMKESLLKQKLFFIFNNLLLVIMFVPYLLKHYF